MAKMISVATGFQSSVNIAYDMNDDSKLKNYIPTKSALSLLEDILLSTAQNSTDRARILIGAYGKGKSHIVLALIYILEHFEKIKPTLDELTGIYSYYGADAVIGGKKINKEDRAFLQEMRKNAGSYDLVFHVLPKIYGVEEVNEELADKIRTTKENYDNALQYLKKDLIKLMRMLFCTLDASECREMSLPSIIRDWCEKLDQAVFEQLFTDVLLADTMWNTFNFRN